ncbi:beta-galactosidase [Pseudomonas fulva]|uniref:beta-galactosidase n=1 Tax=Pseudomonas fulva TaxID=47880 RepID=UPI00201DEC10|nr:beta-galactosidase [Pseudomonas fulva]UQY33044.1 beta-galactosidase [Pseudomonas fulva]
MGLVAAVLLSISNASAEELNLANVNESFSLDTQSVTLSESRQKLSDGSNMVAAIFHPNASPSVIVKPKDTPWKWPEDGSLRLRVQNVMPWPVTLQIEIASGEQHLNTTIGVPSGPPLTVSIPLAGTSPRAMGMQAAPPMPFNNGKATVVLATMTSGAINTSKVGSVKLSMPQPGADQTLLLGQLEITDNDADLRAAYTGIVDKYGQYTRAHWPEKISNDHELKERANAKPKTNTTQGLDQYGGRTDLPRMKATGFFRTQKQDGRWHLVTPDGYAFFSLGVNAVNLTDGRTYTQGREFMFTDLDFSNKKFTGHGDSRSDNGSQRDNTLNHGQWWDVYSQNIARTLGNNYEQAWRKRTIERLKAWHFNTLGNWSDPALINEKRISYTVPISIYGNYNSISTGYDYWGRMPDPFDPLFLKATRDAVSIATKGKRDDPWLLGYFADNELAWAGQGPSGRWAIPMGTLRQGEDSPAKQAFLGHLRKEYGDASSLGDAWGITIKDWQEVSSQGFAAPEPTEAHPSIATDYSEFLKMIAAQYFRTVGEAIKAADPNHMFLGGRLAVRTPEVEEMSAKYTDVTSINTYSVLPEHGFDVAAFQRWDKPVMLTEWHLGSSDRGPFGGGVVAVENESERGKAYARFVNSASSKNVIVGTHWFQYADQPVTGRLVDGENSHVGLVGITDIPFEDFTRDVTKANVHAGGGSTDESR